MRGRLIDMTGYAELKVPVDCVIDAKAHTGEGAIWSSREQALYWVDIPAGRLFRYDPETGKERGWQFKEPLGCFALTSGVEILLALCSGFYSFHPETPGACSTWRTGPEPHWPPI